MSSDEFGSWRISDEEAAGHYVSKQACFGLFLASVIDILLHAFVESETFAKARDKLLTDDEFTAL